MRKIKLKEPARQWGKHLNILFPGSWQSIRSYVLGRFPRKRNFQINGFVCIVRFLVTL